METIWLTSTEISPPKDEKMSLRGILTGQDEEVFLEKNYKEVFVQQMGTIVGQTLALVDTIPVRIKSVLF